VQLWVLGIEAKQLEREAGVYAEQPEQRRIVDSLGDNGRTR
jgi:hypothetical protein